MTKIRVLAGILGVIITLSTAVPALADSNIKYKASGNNKGRNVIVKGQKLYKSTVSLYQGRYYVERDNSLRYCIRHRESLHSYGANNGSGKYRGAYQADLDMAVGMGWMIQKELRATGTPKKQALWIGQKLRDNTINKWAPYYQDMGFWIVWDGGNGRAHWSQTAYSSNC